MKTYRRTFLAGVSAATALSANCVAFGEKKYDVGVSDTEIKIGHTNPYSGNLSAYGVIGKAASSLLGHGECRRRHQRPQDRLHLL